MLKGFRYKIQNHIGHDNEIIIDESFRLLLMVFFEIYSGTLKLLLLELSFSVIYLLTLSVTDSNPFSISVEVTEYVLCCKL